MAADLDGGGLRLTQQVGGPRLTQQVGGLTRVEAPDRAAPAARRPVAAAAEVKLVAPLLP